MKVFSFNIESVMSIADISKPSWSDLLTRQHLPKLSIICFGVWLHAADGLMVSTIMPEMIADLGGAQWVAWTVALYQIGSIVAGAASALLGMRFGLRDAMFGSAMLYMAGCFVSLVSQNMETMLFGRLLQGFGGGCLVALTFVAVSRLFPAELMPRVMGCVSVVWGTSALIGPLVGGVFSELEFWRGAYIFFIVQAGLLALWIRAGLGNDLAGDRNAARIPVIRLVLLTLAVLVFASAGIDVQYLKSTIFICVGIALLILFVIWDRKQKLTRILPVQAFDISTPVGSCIVMLMALFLGSVSIGVYFPILLIATYGISALVAGYILALGAIGWSLAAVSISGIQKQNEKIVILSGISLVPLSLGAMAWALPNGPLWLVAVLVALEGTGLGMAWTFILKRGIELAPAADKDRMATAIPTLQRLAMALGAAVCGIIANASGFTEHLNRAGAGLIAENLFTVAAFVSMLGIVAAFGFLRDPVA
ncbi:MAG: MFS transporter [Hyphomicrobiales bacterium]|nr:MAG: MFS transporter [Hyphomicrobiales bacterium]